MGSQYYATEFNLTNSTIENNQYNEIDLSYNNYMDPNIQLHFNHNTIRDTINGLNNYDLVSIYGYGWDDEDDVGNDEFIFLRSIGLSRNSIRSLVFW